MLEVSLNCFDHCSNNNHTDVNATSLDTPNRNDFEIDCDSRIVHQCGPQLSLDSNCRFGKNLCSTPESANLSARKENDFSLSECSANDSVMNGQLTNNDSCTHPDPKVSGSHFELDSQNFEKLDIQPSVLEYLVRHHAISEESSNKILLKPARQRLALLLSTIGFPVHNFPNKSQLPPQSTPPPGFALLLNGLRHNGHHEVANYLDFSRRITPSPYNSCTEADDSKLDRTFQRRRGQLSILIQLLAIKVCPSLYNQFDVHLNSKCTLAEQNKLLPSCVQELQMRKLPDCVKPADSVNSTSVWIANFDSNCCTTRNASSVEKPVEAVCKKLPFKRRIFSSIFCCFISSKKILNVPATNQKIVNIPLLDDESNKRPSQTTTLNTIDIPKELTHADSGVQKNILSTKQILLEKKSEHFYKAITDRNSVLHDAVVKYLEQSSGVLVLDCKVTEIPTKHHGVLSKHGQSSLCVVVVATQHELIRRLFEACTSHNSKLETPTHVSDHLSNNITKSVLTSKLADDLTSVLINSGILKVLQLQNLRLSVTLDPQEVDLAIKELLDLEE